MKKTYQNWHLEKDDDNIVWLYLDKKDAAVNTLNEEIFAELEEIIELLRNEIPEGLIIASKKTTGFIAGAEVTRFPELRTVEEALAFIQRGQNIFNHIEKLPFPKVAMVQGFCLGGGLELALACDYILAEDRDDTRLGLPEILLGIHPGWGGCIRLPRKIGAMKALNLILTGAAKSARDAYKLGYVDEVVPDRYIKIAAKNYILKKPAKKHPNWFERFTNKILLRKIIAKVIRKKTRAKVKPEHYPAPFKVIDLYEKYGVSENAYQHEAQSLAELVVNDAARNLVHVFFLQERLKGLAKQTKFSGTHIHVIGAGVMGGDIAAWCALSGFKVTLQDNYKEAIANTFLRAKKLFQKKLKEPRKIQAALDRLHADPKGYGIAKADLIIEAIVEKLETKQIVFKAVEQKARPDAILATNTSSILLDKIAEVLDEPSRLIGIHFFNPVDKMRLVEIVSSDQSRKDYINQAMAFVKAINRLPLPVKSAPGFLVNRILMPYTLEAIYMLEEGINIGSIDQAARNFGMPMGPIELIDLAGLDVALSIAEEVSPYFDLPVPKLLQEKVANKEYGKKSGKGFYLYDQKGKQIKRSSDAKPEELALYADRLIYRLINESIKCLDEGIVNEEELLDAGLIFGIGFAPFHGGAMHYIHAVGVQKVYQRMLELAKQYDERFEPAAGFTKLLQQAKKQEVKAHDTINA